MARTSRFHRHIALLLPALVVIGLTPPATAAGPPASVPFLIGAAKVDITPSAAEIAAGNIWLGGFGTCLDTDRKATGILDRIWARAIVITEGATTIAWVVTDVPGQSNRRVNAIRNKVYDAMRIPHANTMVAAQHTHSGPDMQGLWCGVSDSYKAFFDQKVADAVITAHQVRRPASLKVASSDRPQFNEDDRGWGFTDDDLATLQAVDSSGTPIATMMTYASHSTFLGKDNKLISRDWPGAAADRIEARGGGIGLVNVGAQGATGPNWPVKGAQARIDYGNAVADAAMNLLPGATQVIGPMVYKVTSKRLPIENGAFKAAYLAGFMDYSLNFPCAEAGWLSGNPCVKTDFAYLRFGPPGTCQLQAGTAPGELLVRGSQRIKQNFRAPVKLILGLTHNTLGYGVPADEWNAAPNGDDYHEGVSPARSFGDTIVGTIGTLRAADNC